MGLGEAFSAAVTLAAPLASQISVLPEQRHFLEVVWGCPGGSVSHSAQRGSPTSDAGGCFDLGKAPGVFPALLLSPITQSWAIPLGFHLPFLCPRRHRCCSGQAMPGLPKYKMGLGPVPWLRDFRRGVSLVAQLH